MAPPRRPALVAAAVTVVVLCAAACGGTSGSDAGSPTTDPPAPTAGAPTAGAPTAGAPDAAATGTAVPANATVRRVVDGDTIVAGINGTDERVRLIGVDTPETVKPNTPVKCFGREASAHTKQLLPPGTPVRLVLDVEERDRYGRLLAYVYRAADGDFVNLSLARDGYAQQSTFPPNVAHVDEFRAAVADARQAGRGLWSACRDDDPFSR